MKSNSNTLLDRIQNFYRPLRQRVARGAFEKVLQQIDSMAVRAPPEQLRKTWA